MRGCSVRLGVVSAIVAVALSGCGESSRHLSYAQRVHNLEAALTHCSNEPEGDRYRRCLRRTEATIRGDIDGLCPHAGGYTFEGIHEPCPNNYKPSE